MTKCSKLQSPAVVVLFVEFKDKEEFINRLIRIFTEKLVAGSVECYDNELECNNGYEIQFYVGTYCGSYSIIVDVEQLEYRKLLIIYFATVVQNYTIFN